jgi:S1-C subfamily serine protease
MVEDAAQLKRLVYDSKIGSTAALKVVRDGRTIEMKIPIQSIASTTSRRR